MTKQYVRPVRRITVPTLIVERRHRRHWGHGFQEIPVSHIRLEDRTGMLHLTLTSDLTIKGAETDNIYPHGIHYATGQSCELYLEVLPRGRSEAEYRDWVRRPPFISTWSRVAPLPTQRTPLVVSSEARNHGGDKHVSSDAHLTLMVPAAARPYLGGVLPYIGVDPVDVPAVIEHVKRLFAEAGHRMNW